MVENDEWEVAHHPLARAILTAVQVVEDSRVGNTPNAEHTCVSGPSVGTTVEEAKIALFQGWTCQPCYARGEPCNRSRGASAAIGIAFDCSSPQF